MLIIGLIYNLSVLVAIIVISGFIDLRYKRTKLSGKVFQGILFGSVAIIGMMNPVVTSEGIFFDGRSIVISLAALFFGPISGAISAIIAILFRLYLGGIGKYLGVMVVITSFLIGWIFYEFRKRKKLEIIKVRTLLTMGVLVHLVM
ncbi:MAG: LytS/YhcK type 5TM receptor domain-containing protein, partial [Ignavibacteria bacterium]|nr:LytS/YhcK type 5TM receptor domain-containing protein [Ignavibacteria bacterium]